MNLFPRITVARSASMVQERSELPVEQLVALSGTRDRSAIFAATGGRRIPEDEIREIQSGIRLIAAESGYPDTSAGPGRDYAAFDARSARFLFENMDISAAEAGRTEVWSFLGCVVLPDVVRWRFPGSGSGTTAERFAGSGGVVRNTFSRLWWRAAVLRDPAHQSPYHLISELGEDELVQIMERPALSGFPALAVAMGNSLLEAADNGVTGFSRMDLMRELTKRLRRFRSIVSFESLDDRELGGLIMSAASASVFALSGGDAGTDEQAPVISDSASQVESRNGIPGDSERRGGKEDAGSIEFNNENVGDYLRNFGFDVRDRLELGGNLWVMGDEELSSVISALENKGLEFVYRADGGSGTGYESAWLLQKLRQTE